MTFIDISRLHFPITTLGPGRRVGIWFQGCSIRCPGCISADTWATGRGRTTVDDVLKAITRWAEKADGVTVSGGEPFDQPEALLELLRGLRERIAGDILVYSGHPREALDPCLVMMDGLIDALITDPFEIDEPNTLGLRGSDNQRLHLLTPMGRARFKADSDGFSARRFDLMIDNSGEVWMAGIPGRHDFKNLAGLVNTFDTFTTTQDRSVSKIAASK